MRLSFLPGLPVRIRALAILIALAVVPTTSVGQDADSTAAPDLLKLVDQVVDLTFADGHMEAFLTVVKTVEGKTPGSLRSITVRYPDSKRQKTFSGKKIAEIFVNDRPLDAVYDKKQRGLVHSSEARAARIAHQREVSRRLQVNRDVLWQPLTQQEQEKFLANQHKFLKSVQRQMPHVPFQLVETDFFLFFTDLTPDQVGGYIVSLDAMYEELCKAFGLSHQKNIWCGKCVVIAFSNKQDYFVFEETVMENPSAAGSQGMCHQFGNGEVKFAGYRNDGSFFGHVLVHETTHGFTHRYLSSARSPSWLNEGIADWVTHAIFKDDKIPRRQKKSAQEVLRAGGWGDFLTTNRIEYGMYGSASALVDILVANDQGGQFRQFFKGIKEGKDAEESLKDEFGISYQDLKIRYAELIAGMPRN